MEASYASWRTRLRSIPSRRPWSDLIDHVDHAAAYPNLVSALEGRGYAEDRLDAILGGNLTALLRSVLPS